MLWSSKLLVALVGVSCLVTATSCVLVQPPPHPMMNYLVDAKLLWNTVTGGKMLPGVPHALNDDWGVTPRWKEFLHDHGTETMTEAGTEGEDVTSSSISETTESEKAEPAEQFVARKMVNAFTARWIRIYEAEREAEAEALEREEQGIGDSGSGKVTQEAHNSPTSVRSSESRTEPKEHLGQPW
ncbi:hypothetical protein [Sporisorium scitamineum]|uniref:Transmembrane protein n=1 Tax=Sporisorium scitamineum TaxID=49012 RepID=A0A0F7RZA5_9BASI|nr:hypothetical protein [Sporisorium scitamineum]